MTTADTILTAIDGSDLRALSVDNTPVSLTVRRAIVETLVGGKQDVSAEEKLRRYTLAQIVQREGIDVLREDELDLIRKLSGDVLSVQAYGALHDALKGVKQEC